MFTGIIQDMGEIQSIEKAGDWVFVVKAPRTVKGLPLGASVACSGVCLTVVSMDDDSFKVQVSGETLEKTTAKYWSAGDGLNLERALKMGDELGGHMVSGHVDGIAQVLDVQPEGDSLRFTYEIPESFAAYLAPKGSIALDGISLTINEVENNRFGVNIIPHTQDVTTMGRAKIGDQLNFEIDLIARYVGQFLAARGLV